MNAPSASALADRPWRDINSRSVAAVSGGFLRGAEFVQCGDGFGRVAIENAENEGVRMLRLNPVAREN